MTAPQDRQALAIMHATVRANDTRTWAEISARIAGELAAAGHDVDVEAAPLTVAFGDAFCVMVSANNDTAVSFACAALAAAPSRYGLRAASLTGRPSEVAGPPEEPP
ncbi:hypothetical protein [Williamsia muralis]|uniref:hypothetical protein n=1 Tax=Williamsia marianensis TaxID=85044 RepID=UPI0037F95C3A